MYPQRRLRRRYDDFIVPWNPDAEIPLQPRRADRIDLGAIDYNEIPAPEMLRLRRNAPVVFGRNEDGSLREKPKGGLLGRLGAGLKTAGMVGTQGFQTGNVGFGIGSLIGSLLGGAVRPDTPARIRREESLAQEAADMERNQEWMNRDSIIRAREAETQARLRPKVEVPDYGWIPDPNNPEGADVYAPLLPGTTRALRQKPEVEKEVVEVEVPGAGRLRVSPRDALSYYGQVATRGERAEQEAGSAQLTNQQLQQSISEAQTERDRIGASLKDVPPTIMQPGRYEGDPPVVTPNPAYTDLMSRYRALDDDIRKWRTQIKPVRLANGPTRSGGKQWSASRWAAANPGKDVNAAIQQAKRSGLTVID